MLSAGDDPSISRATPYPAAAHPGQASANPPTMFNAMLRKKFQDCF
jgi:hypothetical protein